MLSWYRTLKEYKNSEIVIKRSRFIGHARPVYSEAEALQFMETIRKEHSAATHNCYAYVCGERDEWQKFSDDGEPGGTAGKPILEVMKHYGLKNAAVVVTRYFGGIMLGAGGLVRAYTDGAVAGIEAAGPVYRVLHREILVEIDYTWYGKVENELRSRGVLLGETAFTDKVCVPCLPLAAEADAFTRWMTDFTQGQGTLLAGECLYVEHDQLPASCEKS